MSQRKNYNRKIKIENNLSRMIMKMLLEKLVYSEENN